MLYLRFATMMLVALSMAMAVAHLLEMPVRLAYPPDLWIAVTVETVTYRYFGPLLGAWIESLAWIGAVGLAVLCWLRRETRGLATVAAALMVTAHATWWIWVNPANAAMAGWETATVPAAFDAVRAQWEYAHAARALLQIAALACLVAAALSRRPAASRAAAGA